MIEIGVFHNGASDLPVVRTPAAYAINDGNLAEVHESSQRTLVSQVRQGILADKLGFNYFFMTEHHFQPEGAEFSPNPLLAGDCDRRAHKADSARPGRQYRDVVASGADRRAGRDARCAERRAPRIWHRTRLSTPRGRGFRVAVRDDSGPGAQSRVLPGSLRHHPQVLDAAVVLASWAVLHDSACVHALEPSADHRVLRDRHRGPQARGCAADRATRIPTAAPTP